jgi:hypothetical protein
MAIISETSTWDEGIYQIEKDDDVLGGDMDAPDNKPHCNLANRTAYLKKKIGAIQEEEE